MARRTPSAQAWLRTILANQMADALRNFRRQQGVRELSIERALEESSARLDAWVAAERSSPSQRIVDQERLLEMADAMAKLPEDQRIALELRHLQGLSVPAAAQRHGQDDGLGRVLALPGDEGTSRNDERGLRRWRAAMVNTTSRADRLGEILGAYFVAVEEGHAPNRQELLAQHPDLAGEMAEYFAEQDRLDRIWSPRYFRPAPVFDGS